MGVYIMSKPKTQQELTGGKPVGRWIWKGDIMVPMFEQKISNRTKKGVVK